VLVVDPWQLYVEYTDASFTARKVRTGRLGESANLECEEWSHGSCTWSIQTRPSPHAR
jgi:hypothetical protein